jgi:Fe-S cluster assembly ATP-binding protein
MKPSALLSAKNLTIAIEEKEIVHGIDLAVKSGEIHAIMGPNGSGKSTLVSSLMGHPKYEVTVGTVTLGGKDLLKMSPDERARAGLFLAFQYPKEIAGVSLRGFLFAAKKAIEGEKSLSPIKFAAELKKVMKELHMDPAFAERSLNQGFSGGEKKKTEILQMKILQPKLALLDETDSGLDVDALKIVAEGVNSLRGKDFSAIIVTHYARLLEYIKPDCVHVMIRGKIVESGGPELARKLEKEGYAKYGAGKIALE